MRWLTHRISKKYQQIRSNDNLILRLFTETTKSFFMGVKTSIDYNYVKKEKFPCTLPVNGSYLISTDKGIYILKEKQFNRLTNSWSFGIDYDDERVYYVISGYFGEYLSMVVSVPKEKFLTGKKCKKQVLFKRQYASTRERIHQIAVDNEALYIANTGNNTITVVGKTTGKHKYDFAPIQDCFGNKITKSDSNHLNSVTLCGDAMLFTLFRAGENAAIGITDRKTVELYSYPNRGIHDIEIGDGIYISDTFGNNTFSGNGAVIKNNKRYFKEFFDENKEGNMRGLSITEEGTLAGDSYRSARSTRFAGNAQLIFLKDKAYKQKMPFSQVYDIVSLNETTEPKCFKELQRQLKASFGEPLGHNCFDDCLLKREKSGQLS